MKKYIFLCLLFVLINITTAKAMEMNHMNRAYMKVMENMHQPMMDGIMNTQDADTAFVQGMIAHHQGAIEMAMIELEYGKDPKLRKLAQDIIDAQNKEIEFMKQWLQKNKHR